MMRIFLNKKELQTTINIWFHQVNAHLVKKRTIWHDILKLDYCNWLYSTESKLIFPRFLANISWSVSWNLRLINLNFISKGTKNGQQKRATCFATSLQNELNSDVPRFTALVQAFLATNQVVDGAWILTSDWIKLCGIHATQGLQSKIASAGAGKTRNMYRFCCNKWNYALISATTFRNLQQSDLLQDRFDSRVVKRATSLFSSHSSNVVKQFELFFPVLPYLYV